MFRATSATSSSGSCKHFPDAHATPCPRARQRSARQGWIAQPGLVNREEQTGLHASTQIAFAARREGNAWIVVEGGRTLAQRHQAPRSLHVARIEVSASHRVVRLTDRRLNDSPSAAPLDAARQPLTTCREVSRPRCFGSGIGTLTRSGCSPERLSRDRDRDRGLSKKRTPMAPRGWGIPEEGPPGARNADSSCCRAGSGA